MRITCWNVGTLIGKSFEVAQMLKRRKVHIACLQETRWNGTKARELGEGYKLFYSGSPNRRNGVDIVLSESLKDKVVEVKRCSDRDTRNTTEEKLIIGADFNAHIRKDRLGYEQNHGGYGHGLKNKEGEKLLQSEDYKEYREAKRAAKKAVAIAKNVVYTEMANKLDHKG
ncbi:uncharacterized protein LOC135924369 [Gordionus sp. m RMFG-2023]|uniref:uncharacterized protein LOC135924369 n=1 Tax=Gordionus sp. m RMFG-2023 TaxID=3053472 RepID=UPI0031FDAF74